MKTAKALLSIFIFLVMIPPAIAQDGDCNPPVIICPEIPFQLTMCGPGQVCVDVPIESRAPLTVEAGIASYDKAGGLFCWPVDTSGTYIFTIMAMNECGADTCQITAVVTINYPPVIECPQTSPYFQICEPQELSIALQISGYDDLVVEGGTWSNGYLYFYADTSGTYNFHIVAGNGCGEEICDFSAEVDLIPEPVIACPGPDTILFQTCIAGLNSFPLEIVNATYVDAGDATWDQGQLFFDVQASGYYDFTVIASNDCWADTCQFTLDISLEGMPVITCPTEYPQFQICEAQEICIDLPIENPGTITIIGYETAYWANDQFCFTPLVPENHGASFNTYTYTVIAETYCGADTCYFEIAVQYTQPPVIYCPEQDTLVYTACPGDYIRIDVPMGYQESYTIEGAEYDEMMSQVKFVASESEIRYIRLIATNFCGVDTCDFYVDLTVIPYPSPDFSIDSATSGQLPVIVYFSNDTPNPEDMTFEWDFGDGQTSFEFEPAHAYDTNGFYDVSLKGTNECGWSQLTKHDYVRVAEKQAVVPTNEWISVYCLAPMLNDVPLEPGDVITAYDPDGVLCGMDFVREDGSYGFMPIYRDDPYSDYDEGPEPGDPIRFKVNFDDVFTNPSVVWTHNGDRIELCHFSTENCLQLVLHEGWNLVSWNVAFSTATQAFFDNPENWACVDVIMGFDRGGLTYVDSLQEFSTLLELDYYHGYWFKMNCEVVIEICAGEILPDEYIPMFKGWNLVSYWPDIILPIEEGFASIMDFLLVALGFDNGGLTWLPEMPKNNTLTELKPGFGYWAKLSQDDWLIYPGFEPPLLSGGSYAKSAEPAIPPSKTWMSIYGSGLTIDGLNVPAGSRTEVFTSDGILCGAGTYDGNLLRFTPVYGYDQDSPAYPHEGDRLSLHINGQAVYPELTMGSEGLLVRIGELFSKPSGAAVVPEAFALGQNYPNPFNPSTLIPVSVPTAVQIDLSIFNLLGQKVKTLASGYHEAGSYEYNWDGTDQNGQKVSSGIYLYRLRAGDYLMTRKMILTK